MKSRVYPGLPWVIICDHFNGGFHHRPRFIQDALRVLLFSLTLFRIELILYWSTLVLSYFLMKRPTSISLQTVQCTYNTHGSAAEAKLVKFTKVVHLHFLLILKIVYKEIFHIEGIKPQGDKCCIPKLWTSICMYLNIR